MRTHAILLLSALLFWPGCGAEELKFDRAQVSGSVTVNGEPLSEGVIRFIPQRDTTGQLVAAQIAGGKYEITAENGPAVGKNRVEITASRKTGAQEPVPDAPPGTMQDVTEQYIPAEYNTQSQTVVEIKPGDNKHDFPLEFRATPPGTVVPP